MTLSYAIRAQSRKVRRCAARAAAPEGGALSLYRSWVRGCLFLAILAATPLRAQTYDLPSGSSVTLSEALQDKVGGEDWLRLRFVAPHISQSDNGATQDTSEADFAHLCDSVARPYLEEYDLMPDIIVISMMDRPVEFGTSDPDATQFFEAFRITDGTCILEAF